MHDIVAKRVTMQHNKVQQAAHGRASSTRAFDQWLGVSRSSGLAARGSVDGVELSDQLLGKACNLAGAKSCRTVAAPPLVIQVRDAPQPAREKPGTARALAVGLDDWL